ncbi:anti-CBASS protein Acb1 family protein [Vreelandella populi]|uniref:DUF1073 domain-containing protein n=1 Tax=Vreelandella populi TaxID=2498858 RepID=A0A3S0YEM3_9GAMM|nr:anti-CBASS Acb1 family protein [Halomonas populi]RUR48804.1 DUF1073 domain-containing protein [Halomonas populi]
MGAWNNIRRSLFGQPTMSNDAKRATAWQDYGYPEQLEFDNYFTMFARNGIARAGVMRHVEKTWETNPWIVEGEEGDKPRTDWTPWEKQLARVIRDMRLWSRFSAADWRGRVGQYSALYLTFADNQDPDQPVARGAKLIGVKPLYEAQIKPTAWHDNPKLPSFGMPSMYQFQQFNPEDASPASNTSFEIHPDRIHILAEGAEDDSIYGVPALQAGFNSLLDIEKIRGAGGEGFWKAARGAWALSGEVQPQQLAAMLGVEQDKVAEALNDTAADFASGMDKLLMLGGMKADSLSFNVPRPREFYDVALEDFASSVSCPVPELIGQQIAQRSSEENSRNWQQTIMSRRRQFVGPNIEGFLRHLMRLGSIPYIERFYVAWDDLTDSTASEKLDNAKKMSEINKNLTGTGLLPPFTENEMREAAGSEADPTLDGGMGFGEDDDPPANSAAQRSGTDADEPTATESA